MSLEATHMRFALELKEEYKAKDIQSYIVGTIYPDSRYVTGIDRNLTHNEDILSPSFAKNDFRKGWQVHQLCDIIQNKMRIKYLPELLTNHNEAWNKEEWINASASKIVQDMNDLKQYDLQSCLKHLEFAHNPNGEKIEDIKKYNQIMIDLYKGKKETTVEDNYKMWLALGIDSEHGEAIKEKTNEVLKNKELVERIHGIYDKMIEYYKENYSLGI